MKPTIYWQKAQIGDLPPGDTSNRAKDRWTEETEFGTVLRGDGLTTGIYLGSLTNGSSSDEFSIVVSHNALNEVTNCKFYFQPTTNVRTGGVGFTHTDDAAGALLDFDEMKGWGNKQKDLDDALPTGEEGGLFLYPTFAKPATGTTSGWVLRSGNMEDVTTSKDVDDTFYYNATPFGTPTPGSIQPFLNYTSSDALFVTSKLIVPNSLEVAGARQNSIVLRLVYTF